MISRKSNKVKWFKILLIAFCALISILIYELLFDFDYFNSSKIRHARNTNNIEKMVFWDDSVGVRRWLKRGGNPNFKSKYGESLLYVATGPKGGLSVTKLLINAGANLDVGAELYTPLMNAASWCNYDEVKLLLEKGADPSLSNEKGLKASELCDSCDGLTSIRDLILSYEGK